tara:strand:+ start:571 stop:801 length:231 start_codon:yes stop_codon:yes gene_type:complete
MKNECIIKRFILFVITFPAALVFSFWAGYMIGTVLSFANFNFIPYTGSNPNPINYLAIIGTLIFYFYILFFKTKHK